MLKVCFIFGLNCFTISYNMSYETTNLGSGLGEYPFEAFFFFFFRLFFFICSKSDFSGSIASRFLETSFRQDLLRVSRYAASRVSVSMCTVRLRTFRGPTSAAEGWGPQTLSVQQKTNCKTQRLHHSHLQCTEPRTSRPPHSDATSAPHFLRWVGGWVRQKRQFGTRFASRFITRVCVHVCCL